MSNVRYFPTQNKSNTQPDPTTPEGWRTLLFKAGDAVVAAQMEGGDVLSAKAAYSAIEAKLPEDVREALTHKVKASDIADIVKVGWDFVSKLIELKHRF